MTSLVCQHLEVERTNLMGPSQKRWLSYARHVLIYLICAHTPHAPEWKIGLFVGRRTQAVVNKAYHKIEDMIRWDKDAAADVQEILRLFKERKKTTPTDGAAQGAST